MNKIQQLLLHCKQQLNINKFQRRLILKITYITLLPLFITSFCFSSTSIANTVAKDSTMYNSWNDDNAKNQLIYILKKYADGSSFGFQPMWSEFEHHVFGYYHFLTKGKPVVIAITYTKPSGDYSCHPCSVSLSIFEFEKSNQNWAPVTKHINVMHDGSFGSPPSSIEIKDIRHDLYGVITRHGNTQGGYLEGYMRVHTLVGENFKEVLFWQTTSDDSGSQTANTESWQSTVNFKKTHSGYYDIIINRKGIMNKSPFNKVYILKFDGDKYSTTENVK